MFKIIFMAKETFSSTRALDYLCKNNAVEIAGAVIRDTDLRLKQICEEYNIQIFSEEELRVAYGEGKLSADYIFSFYWKRVKKDTLAIPRRGSINFHPGPLPEARGSGYHMAILENWGYFGVTAHYMDEEFDTGPIIECRHFPISDRIVNKDLVRMTHEQLFSLFKDIVEKILRGEELPVEAQADGSYYSLHDLEASKMIGENENPEEVDRKIRAFWNPPYSGAQIEINGKKYTVINDEILHWIDALQ